MIGGLSTQQASVGGGNGQRDRREREGNGRQDGKGFGREMGGGFHCRINYEEY